MLQRKIKLIALVLIILATTALSFAVLFNTASTATVCRRAVSSYDKLGNPNITDVKSLKVNTNSSNVKITDYNFKGSEITVHLKAIKQGQAQINLNYAISGDNIKESFNVYVNKWDRFQIDSQCDGWQILGFAVAFIMLISFVFVTTSFNHKKKKIPYSYESALYFGITIMFAIMTLFYLLLAILSVAYPYDYTPDAIMSTVSNGILFMVMFSLPIMTLFTFAMSISNFSLMRHEGRRPVNALGALAGVLFVLASVNLEYLSRIDMPTYVMVGINSVILFFECLFFGVLIYAQILGVHNPEYNKDYLIILGCKIKSDGTLLPLLKGRVDKAIDFYNKQLEATGKKAYFVPSGGQGSDEVIPEGQAMANYLISQGIPQEQILPETNSKTTYENMKFSKKLIEEHNKGNNVAFFSTNYHIFRGGIFATKVGLKAEGSGSKTKWYFWPNALVREFVGLIVSEWKKTVFMMIFVFAFGMLFSNLYEAIQFIASF